MTTSNYQLLERLHAELRPRGYLEVGVRFGDSLKLADCPAYGIDPEPQVTYPLRRTDHYIGSVTSDSFFESWAPKMWEHGGFDLDLAYIDGMHLYEFALRDFLNICRWANERTVIVFDDTHPYNAAIATRNQHAEVDWTGDVWKTMDFIRYVPGVQCAEVDVNPTGAFVVWGITETFRATLQRELEYLPPPLEDLPPYDEYLERRNVISVDELMMRLAER